MRRIRLIVSYDGTNYCGWQIQENAVTVEGTLTDALRKWLKEDIEIIGASRTDSGVHAYGNIAVFDTYSRIPAEKFAIGLNHYLPEDIEVTSLARMPERFHSRLNAVDKTYEYRIVIDGRKHVFERKYVYFPEAPLDVEKMKEASKAFIGTYDFRSFCANKRMKKSTVRTITGIDFCEKDGILTISYTGTGFLYHMVRILTGTLVEAGMGKRDIVSMTELLKAKNRESAGFLAPACGLLLKEVRYE
jgi:tRNA pseudouridine38-40 synthase